MTPPSANAPRVLFVCTGNAERSQIARALFEQLRAGSVTAESAGVEPWAHLHPMALRLLKERGIDIADRRPQRISAVMSRVFDIVVTLGDPAREGLPRRMAGDPMIQHWGIADPAVADGTDRSELIFRDTIQAIASHSPGLQDRARQIRVGGDSFTE